MVKFGWDKLKRFLAQANTWTGTQTFSNINVTGGTITGTTINENFTTSTNPASSVATTTAIVDAYNGVVITTNVNNIQTIANPTTVANIKVFTVINNDTSASNQTIKANSVEFVLTPGEAQCFLWDGSAWGATDLGITSIPVLTTQGGTGRATGTTAYALVATGTTATGAQQTLANGATTEVLVGGGASALPVWTTATGTGAPVRQTSPSLTGTLGFAPATELTIAAGAVTAAQVLHLIDTESDAASDDLVTINGGVDGLQLEIRAAHTDRTVVIKETGNILTGGSDIRLDDTNKYILFTYDGALSKWVVVGGSGSGGGGLSVVEAQNTGHVLTIADDNGKTFTCDSTVSRTFDLPSVSGGDVGAEFSFVKLGVGALVIHAADSDTIEDCGAGLTMYCADEGIATVSIKLVTETKWVIKSAATGTWITTV